LFINDLPQAVQETMAVVFADDTNILLIEKNLTSLKGNIIKSYETVTKFLLDSFIINTEKNMVLIHCGLVVALASFGFYT
jgi:hypothetical protein